MAILVAGALAASGVVSQSAVGASLPLQVAMMAGAQSCVALTFDDGPDETLTPKLLSVLENKGVVATFFVVGYRAKAWPDPVERADADGDEIGNHSWDHPELTTLSSDSAASELTRTDAEIRLLTGHLPSVSRAPYGSMSQRVEAASPRTYIAWNIDTLDWKYPDVARITAAALQAVNGSIILMHDIHPKTIDAVPGIIDGLRQKGFRLVTVSQLLGGDCGGKPVAFNLFGGGESAPAASAAVVATSGKAVVPTAQSAAPANRPPYTLFDDEN
jgi:peptidoglycan/xylan/chitin deacetylase (PgdA/CDA1 family)